MARLIKVRALAANAVTVAAGTVTTANTLNFVNTENVLVSVTSPVTGNANVAISVTGFNPFLLSGM